MTRPEHFDKFMTELKKLNERYDPEVGMLKNRHSTGYNYHSNLRGGYVHSTRGSLGYAVALLDSGQDNYAERAVRVLESVIDLQDADPESDTFGIWPYYYEESLAEMAAPDFNWADFCGKELLQVLRDHADRLPEEILEKVKQAIVRASQAIIRRDMGPHYTNIAIMGTYVTLLAGQLLDDEEIFEYGKKRLKRFYDFTMHHGAFNEYNSPTYTVVALKDLSRMLHHIEDDRCRDLIEKLHDLAWECIALHYHIPTAQWAGPHSRCYRTLVGKGFWSMLQLATDGEVQLVDENDLEIGLEWQRLQLSCPDKFIDDFVGSAGDNFYREIFNVDEDSRPPRMATTHLHPDYALGTFAQCDLWNQRRALVGYWGTETAPCYLHLRCLHDDYDYASAVLHTLQNRGQVLCAVNFATDYGDKHISLDKVEQATITAEDLRLSLEVGGELSRVSRPQWSKNAVVLDCGAVQLILSVPYCSFAGRDIGFEVREKDDHLGLDILLHNGREKELDFSAMEEAICVIGLELIPAGDVDNTSSIAGIDVSIQGESIRAVWPEEEMELTVLRSPAVLSTLYQEYSGHIGGVSYQELHRS